VAGASCSWPGTGLEPRCVLWVGTRRWTGLGDGHGRLRACCAEVTADGRGQAAATRTRWLWLPAEDGTVTVAGPAGLPADFPLELPAADDRVARSLPGSHRVIAELSDGTRRYLRVVVDGGGLVPEHQKLGILRYLVPGQHRQAAEQTTYEQVDSRNDHSAMIPAGTSAEARSRNRAPQGPVTRYAVAAGYGW
jgi:hypothetical protein